MASRNFTCGKDQSTMVEGRPDKHRPIQTSAVIVLGAPGGRPIPPPSPPTPYRTPSDTSLCEPLEALDLDENGDAITAHHDHLRAQRILGGIHVLKTEAAALDNLTDLYETDEIARWGFVSAVDIISRQAISGGKVVVIGVGKSGHIGKKLVATFQSLSIRAVFLHPTEALHGDLGIVAPNDTLLFVTFSGSTKELLLLLPHLDEALPAILLTSHTRPETCDFIKLRPDAILLPAPIHEPENVSFGVSAPTTSTTVALALGDALAITIADILHPNKSTAFAKNHPGGSIGVALRQPQAQSLKHIAVAWRDVSTLDGFSEDSTGADLLRAGYASTSGWVRLGHHAVASPSNIQALNNEDLWKPIQHIQPPVLTTRQYMLDLSADTSLAKARQILRDKQSETESDSNADTPYWPNSVVAVVEDGEIVGLIEARQVLELRE